ncbi:MAG: S9 family peptidase [Gemmatimonadaceae bacterium]|nr:S9 family peptidase [Gemmatimonadaceae bacterium]
MARLLSGSLFLAATLVPLMSHAQRVAYPPTRTVDVSDDFHGTRVADPYRWLEDLGSDSTRAWVAAQNAVTMRWLAAAPDRERIRARLTTLWNYPRVGVPVRLPNGVLFHQRNSGLQKQAEIVARSAPGTAARLVLDPNALSPDGTVAVSQYSPSPDGRHLAYALSEGGADWQDVKVRQVRTGTDLPDVLRWVRFSGLSWTRDGKGFFYSRYPARNEADKLSASLEHHALYYHRIGTPQAEDVLVFERRDLPTWFVVGATSDDGRYAFVYLSKGADARNRLYVIPLGNPMAPTIGATPIPLVDTDDGEFTVVGSLGSRLFLRTDLDAPRRRVVAVDLTAPARTSWRTVVPEGPAAIADVALTSSALVVHRLVDVTSELTLYTPAGKRLGEVTLPSAGTVAAVSASTEVSTFYYAFTSHLAPTTVFRYDARAKMSIAFDPPTLAFDPAAYETRRVFATSKDGTRVPLFVSSRRGLALDGANPTLLYAYGGFGVNLQPTFSPATLGWMDMGGVYVTAALRGGSEYGEAWHHAGMLDHKQNVFDDFIAAAEYLIAERITSPAKLVINGGSNGGLLVGAVMTQRPDLFAVAIPQVGVLDMLRYHRFTGGAAWATEYGSADDAEAFAWLYRYSPLHRVVPGTCYPATLITTADHDDRVVPSHSYKFAAALQAAQGCDRPVLIRVETQGSHGYRPTDRMIEEYADLWAFAWSVVGAR